MLFGVYAFVKVQSFEKIHRCQQIMQIMTVCFLNIDMYSLKLDIMPLLLVLS